MNKKSQFIPYTLLAVIIVSCTIIVPVRAQSPTQGYSGRPISSHFAPVRGPAPLVTIDSRDLEENSFQTVKVSPLRQVKSQGEEATSGASSLPTTTLPQSPPLPVREDQELIRIQSEGKKLLEEKKWNEARAFFEKAARQYADNAGIHDLFVKSRCCLEISNRYHDESYSALLQSLDREAALRLYDEVFNNILRYHVDTPHFDALLRLGLDSLQLTFSEDAFLKGNGLSLEHAVNLVNYCELLKSESRKWKIDSYQLLRECVGGIADLIEKGTKIPAATTIMEFACGITTSLDPYSTFLTRSQMNDIYSMIDGHFVGLGVELRSEAESLLISRVIPNSPADYSGLKRGERILSIDGVPTGSKEYTEQAGNLLQGPEGTSVLLKVRSEDGKSARDVRVVRQRVDVPSVESVHIMNPASQTNRIGYARISCFQKTTVNELIGALRYLDSLRMNCFIIDLRQNPGGLLQEAIEVTNLFVEKGTIVRTRGRQAEKPYYARPEGTWHVPLVILIDGSSASASEIFAGAIRDNRRGLIVGTRSFGKGTVQAIIQLNGPAGGDPVAGLRLTTEKFYSPNGTPYSGIGVQPDIQVEESRVGTIAVKDSGPVFQNVSDSKTPSDYCLAKAFEEAQRILLSDRARVKQF